MESRKIVQISWLVNFYLGFDILSLKSNRIDRGSKLRYYIFSLKHDHLLIRDINLSSLNIVADVLGAAAIDLAAYRESGAQNFQNRSTELFG